MITGKFRHRNIPLVSHMFQFRIVSELQVYPGMIISFWCQQNCSSRCFQSSSLIQIQKYYNYFYSKALYNSSFIQAQKYFFGSTYVRIVYGSTYKSIFIPQKIDLNNWGKKGMNFYLPSSKNVLMKRGGGGEVTLLQAKTKSRRNSTT